MRKTCGNDVWTKRFAKQRHVRRWHVANIVGVVYGPQSEATEWVATVRPEFIVVADNGGKIAKAYGAKASLATLLINKNGKVELSYGGYSAPMLTEVTARMAKLAKIKNRNMDTRPAPEEITSGCPLGMGEKMKANMKKGAGK